MPHLICACKAVPEKDCFGYCEFRMWRKFRKTIRQFRSVYPEFNFTTDIIVGFPGETEEEFQETLDAVKEFNFSRVCTFKYSVR